MKKQSPWIILLYHIVDGSWCLTKALKDHDSTSFLLFVQLTVVLHFLNFEGTDFWTWRHFYYFSFLCLWYIQVCAYSVKWGKRTPKVKIMWIFLSPLHIFNCESNSYLEEGVQISKECKNIRFQTLRASSLQKLRK